MPDRPLRVAVVGSGPSGIYAADALTAQSAVPATVDVLDALPAPFGLVRYGVAPDHFKIRSVAAALDKVLQRPGVRFLGNVEVGDAAAGADVSLPELHDRYDAVVLAYGAARDRALGVPGEDLPGSLAATDLVAWYCGHPQAPRAQVEDALAGARDVVVVGVGNVAVDVVRVLAKTPAELAATCMPQHVLDVLAGSAVADVHLLGRRGPAQAAFTTKELRELGELAGADVLVDPADLEPPPGGEAAHEAALAADKVAARNVDVLRSWAARPPAGRSRRVHVRFYARPVELLGDGRVSAVVVERTRLDDQGRAQGTGQTTTLPAQLVVRSVGYRGVGLGDVPFDPARGVVPNDGGRALRGGSPVPGLYVAGWIKRGPTGIIGTNRKDAADTVAALLADAAAGALPAPADPGPDALPELLAARGVRVVTYDGWRLIDAAEAAAGASAGRARTTLHEVEAMLAAAGRT